MHWKCVLSSRRASTHVRYVPMEEEARNALEAASIAIGCPWYVGMLRESGEKVDASSSELAAFARSQTDGESSQLDDWCASAMTLMVEDCGVSERDAGAIIDEALKAVKRSHRAEMPET